MCVSFAFSIDNAQKMLDDAGGRWVTAATRSRTDTTLRYKKRAASGPAPRTFDRETWNITGWKKG